MASVGRPWTVDEDKLLLHAVAIHGEKEQWKTIATLVPGRTNKACRKRWLHSLSPSIKKTAWTPDEDSLLISLFNRFPNKWSQIAREIPGRTDDACSKRYREALDPSLKKDEWTEEEDARLVDCYRRHGGKWGIIGPELHRSGLGCRNRWRLLERKKASAKRQEHSATETQAESSNSLPRFLAEVWPQFEGNVPEPYWNMPWEPMELNSSGFSLEGFNAFSGSGGGSPTAQEQSVINESYQTPSTQLHTTVDAEEPAGQDLHELMPSNDSSQFPSSLPSSSAHSAQLNADVTLTPLELLRERAPAPAQPIDEQGRDNSTMDTNAPDNFEVGPSDPLLQNLIKPARKRRRANTDLPSEFGTLTQTLSLGKPPRLSSTLPVNADVSILAYACGHSACWIDGTTSSKARFAVSGELLDHFKDKHSEDVVGTDDTPFRCGLKDCKKGWKSINGLQYHLQVSKAHFQRALAAADQSSGAGRTDSSQSKLHKCPYTDCSKKYKQLSGLRYHLSHGHPRNPPMQLEVVPPMVAQRLTGTNSS